MSEILPENFWVEQKQTDEEARSRKNRLEYVKKIAAEKPNAPFVFVESKGYFEVPPWVVVKLSEPGVTLGFTIGLGPEGEAFKYLQKEGIIGSAEERTKVLWAGTAKEALSKISAKEKTQP